MMAEDPTPRGRGRHPPRRRARPASGPSSTRSRRSATADRARRLPRRARRRPRRRRAARHRAAARRARLPACPTPGIRSCSSRRISRPPTPRSSTSTRCSRSSRPRAGRPRTPRSSPARSRSSPSSGVAGGEGLVDGEMVIVDAAAGVVTTRADGRGARAGPEPRGRRAPPRHPRPSPPGALADGTPVPAAREPRQARGRRGCGRPRRRGRRAVPHRVPVPQLQPGARRSSSSARRTRSCSSAFPGKKVVVRVLDAGADKPLAFLNDAHEENPALGLRGIRALRASEDILREQLTALAEADAATRQSRKAGRPVGDGADGRDGRGDASTSPHIARDYGIKTAGRHGGGAVLGAAGRPHPRERGLRLDRHERPHPVHARGRPPARLGRGVPGPVASRRPPPHPRGRRRRTRCTASPSASAARPRPIRCSPSCSSASARRACRWLPPRSPTCGHHCCSTPSTMPASSPRQPSPRTTRHPPERPHARPPPPDRPHARPRQPSKTEGDTAMTTASAPASGHQQGTGRSPALRHVPLRHDHAEHPRAHRVGHLHGVLHRGGVDPQRRPGDDRRAVHPLSAAAPHRLHRRQHRLRHPRRRRRLDRHHGRDRRVRPARSRSSTRRCPKERPARPGAHVHRRDDHGAARGVHDEVARQPVGGQDQGGLRDARQHVLGRHLGLRHGDRRASTRSPGSSTASCRSSATRSSWLVDDEPAAAHEHRRSSRRRCCSSTTPSTTAC